MDANGTKRAGRVLLADDEDQFLRSLGLRLQKAGFECDMVSSAGAALEKLKLVQYDALVSDIDMPGNASLELIEQLPVVADGLPVILLTGRPTVDTAARSVRLRVVAYLIKPPDFNELCTVLDSAIASHRNLRLLRENQQRLQDWNQEVERLIQLLQQSGSEDPQRQQAVQQSYLRLSLRNLVVGLVELESLMVRHGDSSGSTHALEKQDLLNTVRKAVGVIEETRNQVKSKALGELRKDLEALLSRHGV